jgi:hypothetical protein
MLLLFIFIILTIIHTIQSYIHSSFIIGQSLLLYPHRFYAQQETNGVPSRESNSGLPCTLQRQNAENLKQIFPEKEYRGLSPNFHIPVSVSELYIPTMGLPVLLEEICRLLLGIYKFPEKEYVYKRICRCSAASRRTTN